MKKMLNALIAVLLTLTIIVAFCGGFLIGILHTLSDSEYVIAEFGDTDIPGNFDFRLWIELDGHLFEQFGYIG